jgi:hypothetical protein
MEISHDLALVFLGVAEVLALSIGLLVLGIVLARTVENLISRWMP